LQQALNSEAKSTYFSTRVDCHSDVSSSRTNHTYRPISLSVHPSHSYQPLSTNIYSSTIYIHLATAAGLKQRLLLERVLKWSAAGRRLRPIELFAFSFTVRLIIFNFICRRRRRRSTRNRRRRWF